MQSIIDILHKNFQEDHTNSSRFPGFPGVVDTLDKEDIISNVCQCPAWSLSSWFHSQTRV